MNKKIRKEEVKKVKLIKKIMNTQKGKKVEIGKRSWTHCNNLGRKEDNCDKKGGGRKT